MFHANENKQTKKGGVALLISDNIDCKMKAIIRSFD